MFVFWRGAGEGGRGGGGGGGHYSYNDYPRVKHFNEETLHIHVFNFFKYIYSYNDYLRVKHFNEETLHIHVLKKKKKKCFVSVVQSYLSHMRRPNKYLIGGGAGVRAGSVGGIGASLVLKGWGVGGGD